MLYTVIRVILALAAAAVVFVMLTYSREDVTSRRRRFVRSDSDVWVWSGGVFLAVTVALCLLPVENLLMGFATPQSAFRYNHTGEIMEIDEYNRFTHSAEGNISDVAANVIDSRNTNFEIVDYPDTIPFYYGFVTDMDEDYTLYVDGEKITFA